VEVLEAVEVEGVPVVGGVTDQAAPSEDQNTSVHTLLSLHRAPRSSCLRRWRLRGGGGRW